MVEDRSTLMLPATLTPVVPLIERRYKPSVNPLTVSTVLPLIPKRLTSSSLGKTLYGSNAPFSNFSTVMVTLENSDSRLPLSTFNVISWVVFAVTSNVLLTSLKPPMLPNI